jgi:hypothetical protein
MALQHGSLGPTAYINGGGTVAPVYTNPAATKTYIRGIWLFNANITTELVKTYVVPAVGGTVASAGTINQIVELGVASKESVSIEFPGPGFVLPNQNDSIQASTTTASVVTISLFGDYDS